MGQNSPLPWESDVAVIPVHYGSLVDVILTTGKEYRHKYVKTTTRAMYFQCRATVVRSFSIFWTNLQPVVIAESFLDEGDRRPGQILTKV